MGCNREVYADALRVFCGDLEKKCDALGNFTEKKNWKEYTAAVHAVKGGLAGIGAWELAQKVKELEDASRKEDYEFCRTASGEVIKEMEQFAQALRSSALFAVETMPKEQVSFEYMEKKFSELYLLCSSGNSHEAEVLVKELRTRTFNEEIDALVDTICTHVENLDYHLVIKALAGQSFLKEKRGKP